MDENPYQSPQSQLSDLPKPSTSRRRWRRIISNSIFAGLFLTSVGWSWYPDKFVIAMACLAVGLLIRYWPNHEA